MSKLLKFDTYEDYVKAQEETALRRRAGPFFADMTIEKICRWMYVVGMLDYLSEGNHLKGICHGARNGLEADEFKNDHPRIDAFGTDLFPFCGKSAKRRGESDVIEWDFSKQKDEWIGKFDFVYSNSLDHARYPDKTLLIWLDQLKEEGVLFVEWSVSGKVEVNKGDCFAARIEEIIKLMNTVGTIKDLIYSNCPLDKKNRLRRNGLETLVFVVGKKDD